jgi:methyl-accepting chemotaxis protein
LSEGDLKTLAQRYFDIKTVVSDFTLAIGQSIAEPMQESLELFLPDVLSSLEGATRTRVLEILRSVQEGDIKSFEESVARLSTAYGQGQVSSNIFQNVYRTLRDVFQGNLSLTEEYTTRQAEVLENLRPAFDDFSSQLETLLDVVQRGIDNLQQTATSAQGAFASREAANRYLRQISGSGDISDVSRFESAVGAVSSGT